jgi:hypothetical protein
MISVVAFLVHRLGGKPAFKGEGVLTQYLTTRAQKLTLQEPSGTGGRVHATLARTRSSDDVS